MVLLRVVDATTSAAAASPLPPVRARTVKRLKKLQANPGSAVSSSSPGAYSLRSTLRYSFSSLERGKSTARVVVVVGAGAAVTVDGVAGAAVLSTGIVPREKRAYRAISLAHYF